MKSQHPARLALLQKELGPSQAILCSDPHDITYFSGFECLVPEEREAFLIVTAGESYLLYASFSPLPEPLVVKALPGVYLSVLGQHLNFIQKQTNIKELLVDKTRLYASEYEALAALPNLKISALDKKLIWQIRSIKDGTEVAKIKKAGQIAAQAYQDLLPTIKKGMTELEVQFALEDLMAKHGSRQTAFPTIVAFGAHAALPHYQPANFELQDNMAVLIDFGASHQGYRSDITRSFWFGAQPHPEYAKIKALVDEAYAAVLDLYHQRSQAKVEVSAADLDMAARDLINQAGYGSKFIHTTGHGLGLDIHESPSISNQNPRVIQPNMVITVEPGIYLDSQFGYRYENTVLVADTELIELTR